MIAVPVLAQVGGVLSRKEARSFEGYDLVAPIESTKAYLMDSTGKIVHQWETGELPALSTYLLPNGRLLRTVTVQGETSIIRTGGGAGGEVNEFDWDGKLTWTFRYLGPDVRLHHDIAPLPNGNILMVAWERKSAAEAIAAGRLPQYLAASGGSVWPDHVIEVSRDSGGIVWEWHVWDHLIQDADRTKPNFGNVHDHPERIDVNFNGDRANPLQNRSPDWNHVNSVSYNEELDQIMLSVPTFGEIWVIDHSTTTEQARGTSGGRYGKGGDLLYRWGNPQSYHAGTEADRQFYFQHSAHWVADDLAGGGNMLIFDNGQGRPAGEYSRVIEIVPPVISDGAYLREGARWGPTGPSWTYQHLALAARVRSGAQRLPNGNTLICDGVNGRLIEVEPGGEAVWELLATLPSNAIDGVTELFRVLRYPPSYPGLMLLGQSGAGQLVAVNAAGHLHGPLAPGQLVLLRGGAAQAAEIELIDDRNQSYVMSIISVTQHGSVARIPPEVPIGSGTIRSGEKSVRVVIGSAAPGLFDGSSTETVTPDGLNVEVKATGTERARSLTAYLGGRRAPVSVKAFGQGIETLAIGPVAGVAANEGLELLVVADGIASNRINTPRQQEQ